MSKFARKNKKRAQAERLANLHIPKHLQLSEILDNQLFALSTIDGRDRRFARPIASYFSEFATIITRAELAGKFLAALSDVEGVLPRKISSKERKILTTFGEAMTQEDVEAVKQQEKITNHDIVALRLFMKEKFKGTSLEDLSEYIDLGLTSEDKNNLTYRLMLMRATHGVMLPVLKNIGSALGNVRQDHANTPMLARTHSQPAGPTTVGKEFAVFQERLNTQIQKLANQRLTGKLNGAVGNWNSLHYVFPDVDWIQFSRNFVNSLGLTSNDYSTQINPYDDIAEYLQTYIRINNILVGLDDDIWHYIGDNWIVQIPKEEEAGSSAMPQKVNPIDFEKSEGNLEQANDLMEGYARRLMRSRLQRDLRDSTQVRNIGLALGFSMVGYATILSGFPKIAINEKVMREVLSEDWTILSEPLQIYLRANTDTEDPFELIKQLTRGKRMSEKEWLRMIDRLAISSDHKAHLRRLTPETYLGKAQKLARGLK